MVWKGLVLTMNFSFCFRVRRLSGERDQRSEKGREIIDDDQHHQHHHHQHDEDEIEIEGMIFDGIIEECGES